MNTSKKVMSWGEEITPLEMQETKGGMALTEIAAIAAGLCFIYEMFATGGDLVKTMELTRDFVQKFFDLIHFW
jgi:hypothetical protein